MTSRMHLVLMSAVFILSDAAALWLLSEQGTTLILSRLISLVAASIAAFSVGKIIRRGNSDGKQRNQPGLWPLLVVAILLNLGLFITLAARSPQVQPLAHLAIAWCGTLLFGVFGFYRIRRWRD